MLCLGYKTFPSNGQLPCLNQRLGEGGGGGGNGRRNYFMTNFYERYGAVLGIEFVNLRLKSDRKSLRYRARWNLNVNLANSLQRLDAASYLFASYEVVFIVIMLI